MTLGYRDIFVIFNDPETGILGELQFHLCHILNIVKKTHPLYEISRKIEEQAAIEQRSLTPSEEKKLNKLLQDQNLIFSQAIEASQEGQYCT